MKWLLIVLLFSYNIAYSQGFAYLNEYPVASDSIVINGRVYDSTGGLSAAPYIGLTNSTLPPDGYWVIKPVVDGVDTDLMRWVLLGRPKSRTLSGTVITLRTDDFQKTINLTSSSARTVYLPSVANVNTTDPIWIKDASGNAGTNNITIVSSALIEGAGSYIINCNSCVIGIYKSGSTYKIQ